MLMLHVEYLPLLIGGALIGLILQRAVHFVLGRNPEILSPSRLRSYGLPHKGNDVNRFKSIFTYKVGKRKLIAEENIKRLKKEEKKIADQIAHHQEKYDANMLLVNKAQNKIRAADTKGQRQTDAQAHLVPVLHETGINLKTIGANTSIAMVLAKEHAFWEQVGAGINRLQVNEHLTDPEGITEKMDTFMPEALKAARETLDLGEGEYEKTVEFWIEQF